MYGNSVNPVNVKMNDLLEFFNTYDDEIPEDTAVAEQLGELLAELDSDMDQEFKNWLVKRNHLFQDPTTNLQATERARVQDEVVSVPSSIVPQAMSRETVSTAPSTSATTNDPEPSVTEEDSQRADKTRMARMLKRYKVIKSEKDRGNRKKLKRSSKKDTDDESSTSDENADMSAIQKGNLTVQNQKIRSAKDGLKKWKRMNQAIRKAEQKK